MAAKRSRVPWRTLGLLGCALVALAIAQPWTVRPLTSTPAAAFDAAKYVAGAWPRLADEASRSAVDALAARQPASPGAAGGAGVAGRKSVFVKATGVVTEIDRRSRVGVARVRIADGPTGEITVQVGPVVRGTALRDAASFIAFNDFANQFEFAAVSNALHARVLRDVVGPVNLDALVGQRVSVLGAATIQAGAPADAPLDIVPVQIQAVGGQR